MTNFNPTRAAELAALHEECDEKATKGDWIAREDSDACPPKIGSLSTDEWFITVERHSGGKAYRDGWIEPFIPKQNANQTAKSIVRLRNSARETAEQLRAAIAEVDSLKARVDRQAEWLKWPQHGKGLQEANDALTRERDELRAQCERLRAVYEAAKEWREAKRAMHEASVNWEVQPIHRTNAAQTEDALKLAIDAALSTKEQP